MILHYKSGDATSHKALGKKLSELKPGEYVIDVTRNRPIRSLGANKYYWGIILKMIAIESGHPAEDLHEMFKAKFNAKNVKFKNDWTESVPGSTKDLDSQEFARYLDRVKGWAQGFYNMNFPEPEQSNYDDLMRLREQYEKVFDDF